MSARVLIGAAAMMAALVGCGDPDTVPVPDRDGAVKSTASIRAERRAYDGAPPTVPHESFRVTCAACHDERGTSVEGVGFAPASPHADTRADGATARCTQCHVFTLSDELFVANAFSGLAQDLSAGDRATPGAPPRIPHRMLMRENCVACHDGPAAREEIRTTHPERWRCTQCHVPISATDEFAVGTGEAPAMQDEDIS